MSNRLGYDVLDLDKIDQNPYCPHASFGCDLFTSFEIFPSCLVTRLRPTVLFANEKKTFYSCSACRDHKQCQFYYEYNPDKPISKEKLEFWYTIYKENLESIQQNLKTTSNERADKRRYCQTCNLFLLEHDTSQHLNHQIVSKITEEMIRKPFSKLLKPIEINSTNAQFIFDHKTISLILNQLKTFKFDSVLCMGTPSLFETLREKYPTINSYLLDIDERFSQFYDDSSFLRYNMFNNHIFADQSEQNYLKFLKKSKNLFVVVDPPYGGMIKLLANTIKLIKQSLNHQNVSIFLFYPYFNESWIKKWFVDLNMVDFKVSYENQKKFSHETRFKKGSTARIFTNLPLSKIELNSEDGYKYCDICEKFTYEENKHCYKCQKCTSKDGGSYMHCSSCNRCVKSSYIHCKICNSCHLESKLDCSSINNDEEDEIANDGSYLKRKPYHNNLNNKRRRN